MLFASVVSALLCAAGVANAQNESYSYAYYVTPENFTFPDRIAYCNSQNDVCKTICITGVVPTDLYCNSTTLVWNCQCSGGPTPNITHFNGTIPFFECQQYRTNCVAATDDAAKQKKCLAIPCGGLDAQKYAKAQMTTTTSATASPTPKPSSGGGNGGQNNHGGNANPSAGNGGDNNAAAALSLGESYGLSIFIGFAMIIFGFGLNF